MERLAASSALAQLCQKGCDSTQLPAKAVVQGKQIMRCTAFGHVSPEGHQLSRSWRKHVLSSQNFSLRHRMLCFLVRICALFVQVSHQYHSASMLLDLLVASARSFHTPSSARDRGVPTNTEAPRSSKKEPFPHSRIEHPWNPMDPNPEHRTIWIGHGLDIRTPGVWAEILHNSCGRIETRMARLLVANLGKEVEDLVRFHTYQIRFQL